VRCYFFGVFVGFFAVGFFSFGGAPNSPLITMRSLRQLYVAMVAYLWQHATPAPQLRQARLTPDL
jgi:hypothetical protein